MNHTTIIGNVGKEPEEKTTVNGTTYWVFSLACNKRLSKENTQTTWWRVVVWRKGLDGILKSIKKGSSLVVYGEMRPPRIYDGAEGTPQISLEIAAHEIKFSPFGVKKKDDTGNHSNQMSRASPASPSPTPSSHQQPIFSQTPTTNREYDQDLSNVFSKNDYQSASRPQQNINHSDVEECPF